MRAFLLAIAIVVAIMVIDYHMSKDWLHQPPKFTQEQLQTICIEEGIPTCNKPEHWK